MTTTGDEMCWVGIRAADEPNPSVEVERLREAAEAVTLAAWTDRYSRLHGHPAVVALEAALSRKQEPVVAYSEADLREAFKAGWKERNRIPGLKRVRRNSLNNAILGAIGGGRYSETALVPDERTYSHAIWLHSAFRKARTAVEGPSPGTQPGLPGEVKQSPANHEQGQSE